MELTSMEMFIVISSIIFLILATFGAILFLSMCGCFIMILVYEKKDKKEKVLKTEKTLDKIGTLFKVLLIVLIISSIVFSITCKFINT